MAEKGLNHRLRQRSRRAGLMIGVSMALTIAVCIGGFSVIYASLDDVVGDFVSRDVPTAIVETPPAEGQVAANAPPAAADESEAPVAEATTAPTAVPDAPAATAPPTEQTFTPDFQSSSQQTIRLRTEAGTAGGEETIATVMTPATPLQSTGEREVNNDPEPETEWAEFRLEDGTTGWVREIDTEPFEE